MAKNRETKIEIIVEKQDDHFWGRIEGHGFMPTGQGKSVGQLIQNVKDSIEDYVKHEGKADKFWNKLDLQKCSFEIVYDVQAFFEEFDELKISNLAKKAGINESLMRRYASGDVFPSAETAKKIDIAIHNLASRLKSASIYA